MSKLKPRIKKTLGTALTICILASQPLSAIPEELPEILSLPASADILQILKNLPLDYLMEKEGRIYIVAGRSERQALDALGLPLRVEDLPPIPRLKEPIGVQGSINGDFHTYAELERDLFALQDRFPNLVRIHDIGDSLEGRNIYAIEITNNPDSEVLRPRPLIIGCHHAREWISVEVPFLIALHLCENYEGDARIRSLVNSSETWIVPLLNPDGLEYSIYSTDTGEKTAG